MGVRAGGGGLVPDDRGVSVKPVRREIQAVSD